MSSHTKSAAHKWLICGDEIFPAVLAALAGARHEIRFETYIFANDAIGEKFRDALVNAAHRGVRVQVLYDAFGSLGLPGSFWQPLIAVGGEARCFNPPLLKRLGFRDHRKLVVCDSTIAFIGGFNISNRYDGDGINRGWFELGLQVASPLVRDLSAAFDEMFAQAGKQHLAFTRLRRNIAKRNVATADGELLLTGPGRSRNPFNRAFCRDLAKARNVQIICAYFLPTWRIRRYLARIVRRGGRVQIILAGKSDIFLSQIAAQSLYRRLLKAGVEIYEYQPQILHAKLMLVDDGVYVGSSNLDPRSLRINYELMVRFENRKTVAGAREAFTRALGQCRQIELAVWGKSRTWWRRLKQRWAYFMLVHVDRSVVRWHKRWLSH